jgi:hypothetical protein
MGRPTVGQALAVSHAGTGMVIDACGVRFRLGLAVD